MLAHRFVPLTIAAVVLCATSALAADHSILGRSLLVRSSGGEPSRLVEVVAKETATDIVSVTDPTSGGATLRVFATGGSPVEQTFVLPAAGWSAIRGGFRYRPTSGATTPVALVLVKRTGSGRALLRAKLSGAVGVADLEVVPPDPGDSGGVELEIGSDRYCVGFGGAAGGEEKSDGASSWRVRRATAEAACSPPPTPTPTPTATPPPTPTPVPSCGNGIVEGSEHCDGSVPPYCGEFGFVCGAPGEPAACRCCYPDGVFPYTFGVECCSGGGIPLSSSAIFCGSCLPDGLPDVSGTCASCCSGVCTPEDGICVGP
jgi:hypothetical protein